MTKCATVGCKDQATERITYTMRLDAATTQTTHDDVCTPCAESYSRRPVLHDLQRWPLVPNPVPADWPADPFAGIPVPDDRPFFDDQCDAAAPCSDEIACDAHH